MKQRWVLTLSLSCAAAVVLLAAGSVRAADDFEALFGTGSTTTTTLLGAGCGLAPLPEGSCIAAQSGQGRVKLANKADPRKDKIIFRFKSATALTDGTHFGDPVGGSSLATLCMYDVSAAAQPILSADTLPGGDCQGKPCWEKTPSAGFKFKDRDSNADGIATIQFKSGPPGENNIKIKGQKENLDPPNLPLTLPVTIQLLVDTGTDTTCFQVTYDEVNRNDGKQFKARAP